MIKAKKISISLYENEIEYVKKHLRYNGHGYQSFSSYIQGLINQEMNRNRKEEK